MRIPFRQPPLATSIVILIVALALLTHFIDNRGPSPTDAVAPNGFHYNPQRTVTFTLGPLEMDVQNKYLVFPWPGEESPATDREAVKRAETFLIKKVVPATGRQLSMKFDLPDFSPGTLQKDRRVIATVAYESTFPINLSTVSQVAKYQDRTGGAVAVPSLDTRYYKAFWLKSNEAERASIHEHNINKGHVNDEVRFASIDGSPPHVISCMWPDAPDGEIVGCTARIAFLPEVFPPQSPKRPPFSLEIEMAASHMDQFAEVADAVIKKIRPWITIKSATSP